MRGTKTLLTPSSVDFYPGHKYAVIGANGCGKSSLFALLQHQLTLESGDYHFPKDWRMVAVAQHTPQSEDSVLVHTISGDIYLTELKSPGSANEDDEDDWPSSQSQSWFCGPDDDLITEGTIISSSSHSSKDTDCCGAMVAFKKLLVIVVVNILCNE